MNLTFSIYPVPFNEMGAIKKRLLKEVYVLDQQGIAPISCLSNDYFSFLCDHLASLTSSSRYTSRLGKTNSNRLCWFLHCSSKRLDAKQCDVLYFDNLELFFLY